jgi:hypothetical protein
VSEDSVGNVQPGPQLTIHGVYQRIHLVVQRLGKARLAARQKNRTYLDKSWQRVVPGMKCGGAAARMGQTEQARARITNGWEALKPERIPMQRRVPPVRFYLIYASDLNY